MRPEITSRASTGFGRDQYRDPNQRAKATVDAIHAILDSWPEPSGPPAKDPERVARGKLGGSKGGKLRAEHLTPEWRAEIVRKAAAARWDRSKT